MALYRSQVILNMDSGLAQDAATNTMYFDADSESDLDDVTLALRAFYQTIDIKLSANIDGSNCWIAYYKMSDPEPRSPVGESTLGTLTTDTTATATEVACVLSYQGAKISGLPQARRRGRIYIGPLGEAAGSRPTDTFVSEVAAAGGALLTASDAATAWTWAQYSQTNGIGIDVTDGWVDYEWDTQRRRGRDATKRTTFQ